MYEKLQYFEKEEKLWFSKYSGDGGKELIGSRKLAHAQERVPRTRYLHKDRKMSTVPLDAVLNRRTERCSPRSRPSDRFWRRGSDTCHQAGREGEKCRPLGKSGWRCEHLSRLPPLLQMLYVDWVSVDLNLTSRVSSGHSSFLPHQNWLRVHKPRIEGVLV